MYHWLRNYLFTQDPEHTHDWAIRGLSFMGQRGPSLKLLGQLCSLRHPSLEVEAFGLKFPNPIGLAAGFDKNALAVRAWPALGFGFVEIGSVTALPQEGNPTPRLFRLPQDQALINRMGFNNHGCEAIAQRLEQLHQCHGRLEVPLGINLGKSKNTPLEQAPQDYLRSLKRLWPHGDYFALNVSSPNTPGLRQLQDKDKLEELLSAIMGFTQGRKPVLLKIAPDLGWEQIDEILALVQQHRLSGLIATNTTLSRENLSSPTDQAGGLSGRPLAARSLEVLRYMVAHAQVPVVSVGGIFTAEDVFQRLEAGAKLVQVYTGFIYQGPLMVRRICSKLTSRVKGHA